MDDFFEARHKLVSEAHADDNVLRIPHLGQQFVLQLLKVSPIQHNVEWLAAFVDAGDADSENLLRITRAQARHINTACDAVGRCDKKKLGVGQ